MRDIQYYTEKKLRAKTNPKNVLPQKYYNFLDFFSKKDLDTFLLYWKYDHKIYSKEEQKSDYLPLYQISSKELDAVK